MSKSAIRRVEKPIARAAAALLLCSLVACGGDADPVALFGNGDFERAYEIFSRRAEGDDIEAFNYLGIHYYLGAGVARDFPLAVQYFERAALENNADAQRNLGIMYLRGLGVKQDNHRAYGWFFQAHTGGNENAREYLKRLADNITPNAGGKAREDIAALVRNHARQKQ